MPEGPEIHREADSIRDAIAMKNCLYAFFHHHHLKPFEKILPGKEVLSVEAFGKGLVIEFGGDHHMYSHNQLYGKWFIRPAGTYPKTNRQLRAEIRTNQQSALLYSASDIDVLDSEALNNHPYLSKLGPDLLKEITAEEIAQRCRDDRFRRKMFASLLLDQSFLSGVGNYLRSEILFHAAIHPSQKPKELSDDKILEFAKSALTITHRSYQTGGFTLDEKRVREAKKSGEKRRSYRHYLFGREDKPCRICGTAIKKMKKSGRRMYICPKCQTRS